MRWLASSAAVVAGGCLGLGVAMALSASTAAVTAHALDGLDTSATTTYTVDFSSGVVRVQIDISFVNTAPARQTGSAIESTIFQGVELGVHGDATAATGHAGDQALTVALTPTDVGRATLAIDFGGNLDYQERLDAVITFDLPGHAPRADPPWRANEAFAAFVGYGYGDPGASTVRIVTPIDATVSLPDVTGVTEPDPDIVTYGSAEVRTFDELADPRLFAAVVIVADDRGLRETVLDAGGRDVLLQAWPDDAEWAAFVGDQVTRGVDELQASIGFPVRIDRPLVVRESVNPLLEGFAGWFDNRTGVIEIGEELEPALMLHELSHAWFNADLSPSRWVTEGLAETYAQLVLAGRGGVTRTPQTPERNGPGGLALDDWEHPDGLGRDDTMELYGYDTSFFVVDAIVDEIGRTSMIDVLTAIEDDREAYRGDGEPGATSMVTDWRRLLDLTQEVAGATRTPELFRTYVVSGADVGVLDERSAARSRYAELVTVGDEWAVPRVVRVEMESWRFGEVGAAIDAATAVLAQRDQTATAAAAAGLTLPVGAEADFETATSVDALGSVATELAAFATGVDAVVAVEAAAAADRTPLELLGLAGEDFAAELDNARRAVTAGDIDRATDTADAIADELAGAEGRGRQIGAEVADSGSAGLRSSAAAAAAGLVVATVGTWVSRRRKERSGGVGTQLDPAGDAPVDGDVEVGVDRRIDLDEDALTRARLGGVDRRLHVPVRHEGEGARTAGVVLNLPALGHVGDPVLQLDEDVRAVVDAESVAGAQVLVDPDTHGGLER